MGDTLGVHLLRWQHEVSCLELDNFEELYILELKQLRDSEQMLISCLANMADAARSSEVREAFATHETETRTHLARIDQILAGMEEDPEGETGEAMQMMVDMADDIMASLEKTALRDMELIGVGLRMEHLEIAGYTLVRPLAQMLAQMNAVMMIDEILTEERAAESRLSALADSVLTAPSPRPGRA